VYDALIAATSIRHELPVSTRKPDDVSGLHELVLRTVRWRAGAVA